MRFMFHRHVLTLKTRAPLMSELKLHSPPFPHPFSSTSPSHRWVLRDPRILRLTGRHPLNCEPPMDVLMSYGFITPPPVHYVRNHGPVRTLVHPPRLCVNTAL